MKRQSDLVQGTALAFAEREVMEACLQQLHQVWMACVNLSEWIPHMDGLTFLAPPSSHMQPLTSNHQPPTPQAPASTKEVLSHLVRLFAQRSIEVDLPWFIAEELLPAQVWRSGKDGVRNPHPPLRILSLSSPWCQAPTEPSHNSISDTYPAPPLLPPAGSYRFYPYLPQLVITHRLERRSPPLSEPLSPRWVPRLRRSSRPLASRITLSPPPSPVTGSGTTGWITRASSLGRRPGPRLTSNWICRLGSYGDQGRCTQE